MVAAAKDEDSEARQRVGDLLDRVLVRAENGYAVQEELRKMASTLQGEYWTKLLARAQGSVGLVNSSMEGTPQRTQAFAAVTTLKQELRALR